MSRILDLDFGISSFLKNHVKLFKLDTLWVKITMFVVRMVYVSKRFWCVPITHTVEVHTQTVKAVPF